MQSNDFLKFYKKSSWLIVKLFICLIASIVLLIFDRNYFINKYVNSSINTLLLPITYIVNKPLDWITYFAKYFENQELLIAKYEKIKKVYEIKSVKLDLLNDVEKKYNELQKIYQLKENYLNIKIAKVLPNKNVIPYQITINKGTIDNIKIGQAVATVDGFIGQITSVTPTSSQVTLINNDQIIPAKIQRTGFKILTYGNHDSLEVPYFPADEDLQKNDLLVTSGIDNNFPAGITIATIKKIEKSTITPYLTITAKPTAKIENKDYVIILPFNN